MLFPPPNPIVVNYLSNQGNQAYSTDSDWYGRFVLPMDQVIFGHKTDEGAELLLSGYVKRIIANCAEVAPNIDFDIGPTIIKIKDLVKIPTDLVIQQHVIRWITALNGEICNGRTFHINGKLVCFAG